jgi:hypothetical protein
VAGLAAGIVRHRQRYHRLRRPLTPQLCERPCPGGSSGRVNGPARPGQTSRDPEEVRGDPGLSVGGTRPDPMPAAERSLVGGPAAGSSSGRRPGETVRPVRRRLAAWHPRQLLLTGRSGAEGFGRRDVLGRAQRGGELVRPTWWMLPTITLRLRMPAREWTRYPTAQEPPSQLASELLSVGPSATGVSWLLSS